jgi:hypothetical protein
MYAPVRGGNRGG